MRSSLVRSVVGFTSALLVAAVAATGCSSSSGPGASQVTATGTIGGRNFTVSSAMAFAGGTKAANTGPSIGLLISSDSTLTCSSAQSNAYKNVANFTALEFFVVNGGSAVTTDTYTVAGGAKRVFADSVISDAKCGDTGGSVTAGTVTITSLSATSVSGSYDLTIGYQPSGTDHVTGTFDAALCDLPDSVFDKTVTDGGAPACQAKP